MESQYTIKNLKINKARAIGNIVIVVEGEEDEFRLLKHIFTNVLDYHYVSMKRNKVIKHEFQNKLNQNCTVVVANTKNSNIKTIVDDNEYRDQLYHLLKSEYNQNLKNTPIYILWDRDKVAKHDMTIQNQYKEMIHTFTSALDNEYEMNGLLLLSYPCHESYNLSNFHKRFWKKSYPTSAACKHDFSKSIYSIHNIDENTLLLAVENMHRSMLNYHIRDYDPSNLERVNEIIFRKEEEEFKNSRRFQALSLISIMLIDLGIIELNDNR